MLQESLQHKITGALGQLSQATQILNESADYETTALDGLLEDIIRQQNAIAHEHEAWAEMNGDLSQTVRLGITSGITQVATQRCALPTALCAAAACMLRVLQLRVDVTTAHVWTS